MFSCARGTPILAGGIGVARLVAGAVFCFVVCFVWARFCQCFCLQRDWARCRAALGAKKMFYLHFEVEQQPVDDFRCLGDLMLGRPLDIMCVVKAPQRPDIRHRKSLEDTIGQHQCKRLWSFLNRYCLPSLLCDQRGLAQSSYVGTPTGFNEVRLGV